MEVSETLELVSEMTMTFADPGNALKTDKEDIKLFSTALIRNVDLRDEVEEAIDNELKLISNDSKYLQSNLLKPPKDTPSGFKKARTS